MPLHGMFMASCWHVHLRFVDTCALHSSCTLACCSQHICCTTETRSKPLHQVAMASGRLYKQDRSEEGAHCTREVLFGTCSDSTQVQLGNNMLLREPKV